MERTKEIIQEIFNRYHNAFPHLAFDWAENECCEIYGMTVDHDEYIITVHTERGDWEYAY